MKNSILRYNKQIDGIRTVAVLAVLISHFIPFQNYFLQRLPFGQGVNLFFVLSGYLITKILLINKQDIADGHTTNAKVFSSFFLRRTIRIFPIYYLTLFYLRYIDFQNTKDVWCWLVTYTTNIYASLDMPYIGSFNHFWSLAVEEQFYLIWPWLILFIPLKYIEKVIIATIAAALGFKAYYYLNIGYSGILNSFTLSCADSLGFGALLAYWSLYRQSMYEKVAKQWYWIPLSFILFAFFMIYPAPSINVVFIGNNFLFSIFAFFIIWRASMSNFQGPMKRFLEHKWIIYIGKISYGIYLYHLFMPDFYNQMIDWYPQYFSAESAIRIPFLFLSSLAFASVSWFLIEKPIIWLKKFFTYGPAKTISKA